MNPEATVRICGMCRRSACKVVDSRKVEAGTVIRRRVKCLGCGHRWTTEERRVFAPSELNSIAAMYSVGGCD
jgi:transcriptional regulator NrdR family protein